MSLVCAYMCICCDVCYLYCITVIHNAKKIMCVCVRVESMYVL